MNRLALEIYRVELEQAAKLFVLEIRDGRAPHGAIQNLAYRIENATERHAYLEGGQSHLAHFLAEMAKYE